MITSLFLRMEKAMKCGNVFELVLLWHALYEHTLAKEKHFKMSLNNKQTHRAAPVDANWSFFMVATIRLGWMLLPIGWPLHIFLKILIQQF